MEVLAMRMHPLWPGVVLLLAIVGGAALLGYYLRPYLQRTRPCPSVAKFEGGYLPVILDSGELVNESNKMKLLYRIQIAHPDPTALITVLNLTGTELGKGSLIRVKPTRRSRLYYSGIYEYSQVLLQNRRYRAFVPSDNPIIIELWGAPGTRNRLRVEELHYFYPGRPIAPDVPPGEPRPASWKG
jgi:hypothetical protein